MNAELQSLSIWIVDDEPGMCLAAKKALDGLTLEFNDLEINVIFSVEMFSSGENLLEALTTRQPHILLLDGQLPGISGFEVLKLLKFEKKSIATILITGYGTFEKAVQATKLGANDFLAKPFSPAELRHTIQKTTREVILTEQAKRLAIEKRQVRFEFISILAHELKSPLNAIDGYLEIIYGRTVGQQLSDYDDIFKRVAICSQRMRKLIMDLLDLTGIESGQKKREFTPLFLRDISERLLITMQESMQKKMLTISLDISPTLTFWGDSSEIDILLSNLISNATKYNIENGSIRIAAQDFDNYVNIIVTDTGIGMTVDEQTKLFKEFSRISNKKTKGIPGSGLGLSIVHKIALLYHGNVVVQSEPDTGTTFTIQLMKEGHPLCQ